MYRQPSSSQPVPIYMMGTKPASTQANHPLYNLHVDGLANGTRSSDTAEKQRVSCPHGGRGRARPSSPLPSAPSGYTHAYGRIPKPQRTYVNHTVRKAHFKMNRTYKVIQGHPYWCRHESRTVCCRNVQLMPTLFLKLTKIRKRENSQFVDFNDLTQV